MKTIILLLALVALSSARFDVSGFYQGFTKQLDFTPQQHLEVQKCGQELSQTARQFHGINKHVIQHHVLSFLFASDAKHREVITSISQYVHTALPACRQVVNSLISNLSSGHRSPDEHHVSNKHLLNYRLQKHGSVIVSNLIRLYDDLKSGNAHGAGKSFAFVLQVLSGLRHPPTIVDYARNHTQNHSQVSEVPVNDEDKFIQESINNALKELGCKGQVSEAQVKQLRGSIQNFIIAHISIQSQLRQANSVDEKEVIILGAVRDLANVGGVVAQDFQNLLGPHLHDLHLSNREVKHLVKKGLHNYYLHLPYLEHKAVDFYMGVRAHHPVETGHALAGIIKIVAGSY